jgi:hypothetical protein
MTLFKNFAASAGGDLPDPFVYSRRIIARPPLFPGKARDGDMEAS